MIAFASNVTPDTNAEDFEKATLTLATNAASEVETAHASATAWILEEYTKTYTTVADFNEGVLSGLGGVTNYANGHLAFKTHLAPQFAFINVTCSGRGTVARISTTNGLVIGEYRTTPQGLTYTDPKGLGPGPQPLRATVDESNSSFNRRAG